MSNGRVPSERARAAAAAAPSSWVYEIDPWFDPDGAVPPHAIIGAWRSGADGMIAGAFTPNDHYQPSPAVRGFRAPLTDLEDALQRLVTGYGDLERFTTIFAVAPLWVLDEPGHRGEIKVEMSSEGRVVRAFTSPDLLPDGVDTPSVAIPGGVLIDRLPVDSRIAINPGTAPTIVFPFGSSAS